MRGMLLVSGVLGPVGWTGMVTGQTGWSQESCWMGVPRGKVCGRVTVGVGAVGSVLTDLGECSVSPVEGGVLSTAEGICVLEVMHCEGE